jgi:SAM-dependent methyltransferase
MIKYRYQGKFDPGKLNLNSIDRLSTSRVLPKTKVLELGASSGYMSRYFRSKLKCQVIGVDINPEAKPDIAGDLSESKTWGQIKKHAPFDLVFASSVLEHLPQPEKTLVKIRQVLKPGGRLIATTGNISWWRQRLRILFRGWQYTDYGLTDRTHLRFFNYYTFSKLIEEGGFKIKSVAIDPGGGVKYFNWLVKYWPNLYALQICVEAVNR